MIDAITKALNELAKCEIACSDEEPEADRCALMQDTPSDWVMLGTTASYVLLARKLLEFARSAISEDYINDDVNKAEICGVDSVTTNIGDRFRVDSDVSLISANICKDDASVMNAIKALREIHKHEKI